MEELQESNCTAARGLRRSDLQAAMCSSLIRLRWELPRFFAHCWLGSPSTRWVTSSNWCRGPARAWRLEYPTVA